MQWFKEPRLHFAVGIEDTFVPQQAPGQRALDEYELTQHYQQWHADIGLAAEVGATMIRYGVPWHVVNPQSGSWEWEWLDRVVERIAEVEIEPIVDLMHYGTPLWLEDQFLNPDYGYRVAEYAAQVAERYGDVLRIYTPLNEPLINAMYCGEWGIWPPHLRGHEGFVKLVRAIAQGIVKTQRAVADVSGGTATYVHVEAAFRYVGDTDNEVARLLLDRRFLVEDLLIGRIGSGHPMAEYLLAHGISEDDLSWFRDNTAEPDVIGINYYPSLSTERFVAGEQHAGDPSDPRPRQDDGIKGLEDVIGAWASRYKRPIFLTETSLPGGIDGRLQWLEASVAALRRMRAEGNEVVGYTWWPLFDMIHWSYRESRGLPQDYLLRAGLYDLEPDSAGTLSRVATPAAARFRALATEAPAGSLRR
jgi:beta-glucosidase/6-phospho-beta-glucosidase/beta-galactosidase